MLLSAAPVLGGRAGRIIVLQGGDESAVEPLRGAARRAAEAPLTILTVSSPKSSVASGRLRDRLAGRSCTWLCRWFSSQA